MGSTSGQTQLDAFLRAFQETAVPRSRSFSPDQARASSEIILHFLARRDPGILRKLRAFILLINIFSFFVGGKIFCRLSVSRRERVLRALYDSPIPIFRKGFWGLNAIAKLGVYGQKSVYADIHYRAKELPR